jgi:hypothetical protein
MLCPSNPTPINRKSTGSRAAIFLEEGMRKEAVSTCLVSPATFPAESSAGKRWQILSHFAIQASSYLHPENKNSLPAFLDIVKLYNILNLLHCFHKLKKEIRQIFPNSKSIFNRCNLSLICVIKDFSISEKSCIFFLTSKSTSSIIHN